MKTTVEVFVLVDAAGDYAVGKCDQSAREQYESDVQDLNVAEGFRIVKVNLTMPLPEIVELTGEVPEREGQPTLTVSE